MRIRAIGGEASAPRLVPVLEACFLVFGLVALDIYIWENASAALDQAYADWAFDQTLVGLKPSVSGFVADEIGWLFGEGRTNAPAQDIAETPPLLRSSARPQPGTLLGRLRIPRLDLAVMVREGAGESTLRRAVGHIPETALPGFVGNVGLAGHRDTFFRPLAQIHKSDAIDLETASGTYRYLVTSVQVVSPRDVAVLKAASGKTLTLVTCYPFHFVGSAPRRFIVHATQTASSRPLPPQPGS